MSLPAATTRAFSGSFQRPLTSRSSTMLNAIPWMLGSALLISSKKTTWNVSGSASHFALTFLYQVGGISIISPVDWL